MKHCAVLVFIFLWKIQTSFSWDGEVTFQYFTSYNKGRFVTKNDIEKSSVNVLKPIVFIIGGLTNVDNENDSWSTDLRDAYLEKLVHNVFVVEWHLSSPAQSSSVHQAYYAGSTVADFIVTIFNKTGEAYLDIHLIGVSLGCEVAASTAVRFRELSGRKINRVTGLEPAYYLISNESEPRRLSAGNADFVDVVRANLSRSNEELTGHADFYVVDGSDNGSSNSSHLISVELFAKSINNNGITATRCDSLEKFRKGACSKGEQVKFGENVNLNARGKYFLQN